MNRLAINGGKPVSDKMIPIAKPIFQDHTIRDIAKVLETGNLSQGPKTKEFEETFKDQVGTEHAYATSSGTAALHIAFMSILKPDEEVIVPDFTFIATASTVIFSRGRPVFADIDAETLTIDPEDVKEKITKKTKVLVPVHLFGNASDMKQLEEIAEDHNLYLVNDSAQAHGTMINGKNVGSFDDLNCYSFYPSKTITTGEGGIVTTNNSMLHKKGVLLRNHGQRTRYEHIMLGLNYRMTEISAVIGLNQMKKLNEFLRKRRHNAQFLSNELSKIPGLQPQKIGKGVNHSYSYYTVIMDLHKFRCNRDEFIQTLKAENIGTAIYYPKPLTKQPALKDYSAKNNCPVAENRSKRVFSLPVHPGLTEENLKTIIKALNKVADHYLK